MQIYKHHSFIIFIISLLFLGCENKDSINNADLCSDKISLGCLNNLFSNKIDYAFFQKMLKESVDKDSIIINLQDTSYSFALSAIDSLSHSENENISLYYSISRGQSAFTINDTIFIVNANGQTKATTLDSTKSIIFQFDKLDLIKSHNNVANVLTINGEHYVYLSEWNGKHRCFVEKMHFNKQLQLWDTELIQTIKLDISNFIRGSGNMDWIIDKKNKVIYTQTYKDGTSQTATALIYLKFKLPNPEEGNKTLVAKDILKSFTKKMIKKTQDKKIYNNQLYIASGDPATNIAPKIHIFDLPNFTLNSEINLSTLNQEPEGLFFYKSNLMVVVTSGIYSIQNQPALYLHLKKGGTLSYAYKDIQQIYFK